MSTVLTIDSTALTFEQHQRVKSFLTECNEHISACLNMPVIVTYTCLPYKIKDEYVRGIVCEVFDLEWHQITGKSRERINVAARMLYTYICRIYLGTTYKQIGINIGSRDHTSAIHLFNRIKQLIDVKDALIMEYLAPAINRVESIYNQKATA